MHGVHYFAGGGRCRGCCRGSPRSNEHSTMTIALPFSMVSEVRRKIPEVALRAANRVPGSVPRECLRCGAPTRCGCVSARPGCTGVRCSARVGDSWLVPTRKVGWHITCGGDEGPNGTSTTLSEDRDVAVIPGDAMSGWCLSLSAQTCPVSKYYNRKISCLVLYQR